MNTKLTGIIQISVDYWGGQTEYKWKVVSIDNKKLVIEVLN